MAQVLAVLTDCLVGFFFQNHRCLKLLLSINYSNCMRIVEEWCLQVYPKWGQLGSGVREVVGCCVGEHLSLLGEPARGEGSHGKVLQQ